MSKLQTKLESFVKEYQSQNYQIVSQDTESCLLEKSVSDGFELVHLWIHNQGIYVEFGFRDDSITTYTRSFAR